MCSDQICLGYLLIAVIVGFTSLIFGLLKVRKKELAENLQLTADQIWEEISDRAAKFNFQKSDLLFGIWQDKSSTVSTLLIKNNKNEIVGRVEYPIASRKFQIFVGDATFEVNFPMTWNQTAKLRAADKSAILASYLKLNAFGKHQFEIPEVGTLISERPRLTIPAIFDYRLNGKAVGITQAISARSEIGKITILPETMPLHLKIFVMAI